MFSIWTELSRNRKWKCLQRRMKYILRVVMDLIKMEPEVDPLDLQDNKTYKLEEKKASSEGGNLSHLEVCGMKTECVDQSYEMKVEDTPVPIGFAFVKSEVDKDVFDLDRVQQERKVEVSSEENEVYPERFVHNVEKSVLQQDADIDREEENLIQSVSNRPDCSNIRDVSDNSIKCNICNKVFVTRQSLKHHVRIHTMKKSMKCDVCGKCFSRLAKLKEHVRIHTGEKPFKCEICGKCFSHIGNLNQHARIHTGERPFNCEECGKCFTQLGHLRYHVRNHTGEKPFKCDVCGKCFSESSNFNNHARIHTGEKRFKCEACGKCFSKSSHLSVHARIHTGERPFKCEVCGKCFIASSNLSTHARIHKGDKPWKCEVCGICFSQLGNLKKHVIIHIRK
ncbi:zinc finger protein 723-like isoform X2 [Periplaneta americana]|uniref:zinc finger protein 723-like isoform X2 n=1 Tax=Periplaneta americana TaxID=6978 RepID=UPI0037E7FE46